MKYGFLLLLPLLLAGCSHKDEVYSISGDNNFDFRTTETQAKKADAIIKAQNGFGSRLLSRLVAQRATSENLLVSPTSIWQALALAASGSSGETQRQAKELLGLQNLSDHQVGDGNRAFNALLGEQKGATILVANSVWFADSFKSNASFTARAKSDFGALVGQFSTGHLEAGVQKINDWVSNNTKNEITQVVQDGDLQGQSAALVNAVYFRGIGDCSFDKSQTLPAPFHLEMGDSVEVPMMNGEREGAYLSGQSFQGVRLPYKNTSCALWALLPQKGKTLLDVIRELGGDKARRLQGSESVTISLPLFEIEWRQDLKTDLSVKSPLLFSPQADLSEMGEPTAGLSAVLHVCKMRVDEEGTVATAATSANMAAGNEAARPEPKVIKFDRPFVVVLVEETSGARLFEGVVSNPSVKDDSAN